MPKHCMNQYQIQDPQYQYSSHQSTLSHSLQHGQYAVEVSTLRVMSLDQNRKSLVSLAIPSWAKCPCCGCSGTALKDLARFVDIGWPWLTITLDPSMNSVLVDSVAFLYKSSQKFAKSRLEGSNWSCRSSAASSEWLLARKRASQQSKQHLNAWASSLACNQTGSKHSCQQGNTQ